MSPYLPSRGPRAPLPAPGGTRMRPAHAVAGFRPDNGMEAR